MKENLRKLGIDMTIRELEWAAYLENVYDRKFDALVLQWAMDLESDPYQIWHTSQRENRGSNHPGFGDAETDIAVFTGFEAHDLFHCLARDEDGEVSAL